MSDALNQIGTQNALTVTNAAVALTLPTDLKPTRALIHNESGGDVRWRADGTDPTASSGNLLRTGFFIDWTRIDTNYWGLIDKVRFFRDAGVDATLEIGFFA